MIIVVIAVILLFFYRAESFWDFPSLLPEDEYGNILINRTSEKNNVRPVTFSHWIHRQKHTCRVCHFELEFNMKVNTTEITEELNKAGRFAVHAIMVRNYSDMKNHIVRNATMEIEDTEVKSLKN